MGASASPARGGDVKQLNDVTNGDGGALTTGTERGMSRDKDVHANDEQTV